MPPLIEEQFHSACNTQDQQRIQEVVAMGNAALKKLMSTAWKEHVMLVEASFLHGGAWVAHATTRTWEKDAAICYQQLEQAILRDTGHCVRDRMTQRMTVWAVGKWHCHQQMT